MNKPKFHSKKTPVWINAMGESVPSKYVSKADKAKEEIGAKIFKGAFEVQEKLTALHSLLHTSFAEVAAFMKAEYELKNEKAFKQGKGSLTWYNFDRSLKVECDVKELIKWDNALMTEALNLLNSYLTANLTEQNTLILELVKSAFANGKGMVDTAKVFQILKYRDTIKSNRFQKACELITKAQSVDSTKQYIKVYAKSPAGNYEALVLNFANL